MALSHYFMHAIFLLLLLTLPPSNASHALPPPSTHFNLSLPRHSLASASLPPSTIFFAGGITLDNKPSQIVDIFNTRLHTHVSGALLSLARSGLAAAAISFANGTGVVAIVMFAGGRSETGPSDVVDIYNVRRGE